jgi:N-acetylglutamate synthase-like GNAT family acetyltransferase
MLPSSVEVLMNIRPAQAADQKTIERIVRDAGINPLSLDWHRFVIAEDNDAPSTSLRIVGVGQIKPHGDGSRELASLAVIPERQGRGIGSAIVRALLARERGTVFLMCRRELESYYARFGFRRIEREEMTPYFRRITRLMDMLARVTGRRGIVMTNDKGLSLIFRPSSFVRVL